MWFDAFSTSAADQGKPLFDNGRATAKGLGYEFHGDLIAAVDVALGLGRPLLVAGEPGCGKTELGFAIARCLGLAQAHFYSVKSTAESRDLFYSYDAIGRFRDAQLAQFETLPGVAREMRDVGDYVEFQALGRAILDAHPRENISHLLRGRFTYEHPGAPQRSVVIIDEIDKAPRDFPNDLLHEIEGLSFRVPEFARAAAAPDRPQAPETPDGASIDPAARPIIIVTSNEERQLPDAFLRRCVFYPIAFPDAATLHKIIANGLKRRRAPRRAGEAQGRALEISAADRDLLIQNLTSLRVQPLQKPPGVSELIDAAALMATPAGDDAAPVKERLARTRAALVKVKDDGDAFKLIFSP